MSLKVSIILTNYNYSWYVWECLKSILKQDYDNIELLVIDDKSTDDSLIVIEKILSYFYGKNITVVKLYHNINIWIRKSCLEWIENITWDLFMRIDADDFLVWTDSVSKKVNLFKKNTNIWFIFSNHFTVDEKSNIKDNFFTHDYNSDYIGKWFDNIILWNKIIASWTLINIKCIDYIKKYIWDWDLWVFLSINFPIWYIHSKWIYYRVHSLGMSKKVRSKWDKYFEKNQWINIWDQGIFYKDYAFLHGFDIVNKAFSNLESNLHNKILKIRALWGCYRYWSLYLLKSKRFFYWLWFLLLSLLYDPLYYIKNFNNIIKIISNIKKI